MKIFLFLLFLFLIFNYENNTYKVVMIVNLIRHGARNPTKLNPDMSSYFADKDVGKLTPIGFRQMVLLGKVIREKYLTNQSEELKDLFEIKKAKDQFLLISSPYLQAVESGVGYTLGLLPEYNYKIFDTYHKFTEDNPIPPVIKDDLNEIKEMTKNYFNFIVENHEKDILFHLKKCKFPDHFNNTKIKTELKLLFINDDEKESVYNFFKTNFKNSLENIEINNFNEKLARSLYTILLSFNENYKNKIIEIPDDIHKTLKRLFAYYFFFNDSHNEKLTKMISSPFMEHLIHFFDHKIKNKMDKLDFYELSNFNYTDLRFVSYSGHDHNLLGIIKNLLNINTVLHYLDNLEMYEKLLFIPFASTIDFHLIKDTIGNFYVKIYINGEELFEVLRSHKEGHEVYYDKEKGIPYPVFRKILKSRIFNEYHHCKHKIN